ncbi:chromosome loss-related protein [Conoideocrella luteorostrata]|uniref:Chromosome loss-related protein n=1 Tax=Conoideocrella luteorostrata TaxID=1105319 RepID=A0AAJ0FV60_9HYPO|nr:chromosome loss-related protein [Conoideocrella luteorostrata]
MSRISIATKSRLPSSLRVESSNTAVVKTISRLSREALILLALDWLNEQSLAFTAPYLAPPRADDDDDSPQDDSADLYPPCKSIEELHELYTDLQEQKGSRRDVVSRILEGDWRHGLTLYQLAMIDFAYLDEHPTSQKWTTYKIQPLNLPSKNTEDDVVKVDEQSLNLPRFHPSTFLQSLQEQVLPDVKAHYHFSRPKSFPLLLLRIFAIESPYNTELALSGLNASGNTTNFSSSRTIYLAFPDGSPVLYITRAQATGPISHGESKSLHSLIANGVPQALSRPRERYTLKPTSLVSRNLEALLDKRGPGRSNAAGGGWSIYANEKDKKSPLDSVLPTPPLSRESSHADAAPKRQRPLSQPERAAKRAKTIAKARFGQSGVVTDGKGIEKLEIVMQDPYPAIDGLFVQDSEDEDDRATRHTERRRSKMDKALRQALGDGEVVEGDGQDSSRWSPIIRISFQGSHVFAGIRQLIEAGIVDGERMPGWMTGEDGVTIGVVRHGLIRGHKGSGL